MEITFKKFFNPVKVVNEANDTALLKLAARVTAEAKSLAPVAMENGGRLRNSIMYRTPSSEGGFNDGSGAKGDGRITARPRSGEAFVGINLDYAIYQEFGTRFMRPQPYLRPAIAIHVYNRGLQDVRNDVDREVALGALKGGQTRVRFY